MEEPRPPATGHVAMFLWAVAAGFAVVLFAELLIRTS
jgi:hypothetical protein